MSKKVFAHLFSLLCIIVAVILYYYFFTSLFFNPSRLYNNDSIIVRQQDSYHNGKGITPPFDENGAMNFWVENYSGSRTEHILDVGDEGKTLSYTWNLVVKRGKFKIVLIDMQNAQVIEIMCEGTGNGSEELNLDNGEYMRRKAILTSI